MNFTSKDNMKNLKRNQFNYHQRIHTQKLAKNILCRIIQGKFLQSFERNMTLQENEGQILKVRSMQDFIHHVYSNCLLATKIISHYRVAINIEFKKSSLFPIFHTFSQPFCPQNIIFKPYQEKAYYFPVKKCNIFVT